MAGGLHTKIKKDQLMNKHVRTPTDEDVTFVAAHMRQGDVEECLAVGWTPLEALSAGVQSSQVAYTLIDHEGTPVAIMGVCPPNQVGLGMIWLLGTPDIERIPATFARQSRYVLRDIFNQIYDLYGLFNYTHLKNDVHHRWLKWLGFKFLRIVEHNNHQFYEFVILKG